MLDTLHAIEEQNETLSTEDLKDRGIHGRTINSLNHGDYISEWNYANGPIWQLTDKGLNAIKQDVN